MFGTGRILRVSFTSTIASTRSLHATCDAASGIFSRSGERIVLDPGRTAAKSVRDLHLDYAPFSPERAAQGARRFLFGYHEFATWSAGNRGQAWKRIAKTLVYCELNHGGIGGGR